ncbi:MAG: hypothetical protein WBE80_10725, partial [Methylocella sp.]
MAARKNPRSKVESKSQYKGKIKPIRGSAAAGSNRRAFFRFEPWFNAGIPEMGRSAQENAFIPLQFLQGETFAFLWVFFPTAIRLRVKIGFMPLARGQHETA